MPCHRRREDDRFWLTLTFSAAREARPPAAGYTPLDPVLTRGRGAPPSPPQILSP